MKFWLKRWRDASDCAVTCRPLAERTPSTAAAARSARAWATFRLGWPASARSTRPSSTGSPNACHHCDASVGVASAFGSMPSCTVSAVCAVAAMPALLAQPPSVRIRLEAIATATAVSAGRLAARAQREATARTAAGGTECVINC